MGTYEDFVQQVTDRLPELVREAESGTIKRAVDLMTDAVAQGGVIRAFGTGHSEAFCMELAGRAGGLIASPADCTISIDGVALAAKAHGHTVIAVTSLQHTAGVTSKHPSGKKLADIGDVVIDNLAPYGDTTLPLKSGHVMGAVSSITGAVIAQFMTIGIAEELAARGLDVPVFISSNVPGGDEHNDALKQRYEGRLRPDG